VYRISYVRWLEIHTVEPLVPYPIPSEVENVIAYFKTYKLPGTAQILAELKQSGGKLN
jgi:hypothetical protein